MDTKKTTSGRLVYVEPTNIGNDSGNYSDAISFPYENYCMSVDLSVRITDRYSCGWGIECGEIKELTYSSRNGSLSFLGGSKIDDSDNGYLTTNFTDVSMSSPSTNTAECLGIESISISYGQWLFPQVVVKFVDVRGATVMMPSEETYYNEANKGTSSDLYRSLFTFPYPMFTLKVKGFYGKGVTYKLAVQDTRLEFNNETGNFNITVSFIGYMYGLYADMPMTYLAASPYMNGGREYWENKIQDGTFVFKDGAGQSREPMITIPDLREKLARAAANEEAISAAAEGKKYAEDVDAQISALRGIEDYYPFNTDWYFYSEGNNHCYYTIVPGNDKSKIDDVRESLATFVSTIEAYDEAYKAHFSKQLSALYPYFEKASIGDNYKMDYIKFSLPYTKDDKNYTLRIPFGKNANTIKERENEFLTKRSHDLGLINFINKKRQNLNDYFLVFIETNHADGYTYDLQFLLTDINEKIKELSERKAKTEAEYKAKEAAIIEKVLGFRPSIRNIFNLIFAHFDTFIHCFYDSTKTIRTQLENGDNKRKKSYYYINNDETDTENVINNGNPNALKRTKSLPPYFGLFKEDNINSNFKKSFAWPGDLTNGDDLEEVKFVLDVLSGAELYKDRSVEVDKIIENLENSPSPTSTSTTNNSTVTPTAEVSTFFPLTTYDFIFKDKTRNPYYNIKEDIRNNSTDDITAKILGIFTIRALYYLATNDNTEDALSFGVLESLNLYKAIGDDVSDAFINFITKYADKSNKNALASEYIDFITKTNDTWKITEDEKPLCQQRGSFLVYWLNKYLPIGVFDFDELKKIYAIALDSLQTDERFVYLAEPSSQKTFHVMESKDYVENVFNCLEAEIEKAANELETKDGEKRNFDEYGKIVRKRNVLKNFKNNFDEEQNGIIDKKTIYNSEGKKVNSSDKILEMSKKEQENLYIKYPTKINDKESASLFSLDLYSQQTDLTMKAYLFLQALPINGCLENGNIERQSKNGLVHKALLLREGSYYWWMENVDNIVISGYKKPNKNQSFIRNSQGFDPLSENSSYDYFEWVKPINATVSREEYLKEMFESWATGTTEFDFGANEKYLNDKNLYINRDFSEGLDIESLTKEEGVFKELDKKGDKLQKFLRDLFFNIYTTLDTYNGLVDNDRILLSPTTTNVCESLKGFIRQLHKIYKETFKEATKNPESIEARRAEERANNPFQNIDIKLSTYMTLKSLYDKWLCSPERGATKTWSLSDIDSDFNNFIYVDTFYHDIGDQLTVNISKVSSWLSSCLPTSNIESTEGVLLYTGKTVYDFLTSVSQDTGGMLMALPHKLGVYDGKRVEEMFTPMPLYSDWDDDVATFVFMYTYKPSEHLGDDETGKYHMNGWSKNGDGFYLTDEEIVGKIMGGEGYTVPAFGVTYAKQNQSIFKNIKLNTESPGVTEAGLAATFNIVSKESNSPRETTFFGQDIYRIYSQYAYKCSVECMGNMQITPLMYFQLNNIPLWKGAYQILKVTHEITAGNISTSFDGIRINRYAIPFTNGTTFVSKDIGNRDDKISNVNSGGNVENGELMASNITNDLPNKNVKLRNTIDFKENNISHEKPIIALTPAHGPQTQKREEWEWSSKVVDRIIDIFRSNPSEYKFSDGTIFADNVQRCNKNGANTGHKGYSTKETQDLIKKYGSSNVISAVPHWNGAGGNYHWTMVNKASNGVREDSMKLAECMRGEFLKIKAKYENTNSPYAPLVKGNCRIDYEPENVDDGAPRLNCACVLTENWFADCKDYENPKEWFNNEGIEEIAQAHAKAIKKYIDQLTPPNKV